MIRNIERFVFMVMILFSISYLMYFFIIKINHNNLTKDEIYLFFILLTFFLVLYYIFNQMLKEKKLAVILSKELENKEQELNLSNELFYDRLKQEIVKSREEDKILYEELKITYMNELVSNIAHQWRQPLSVISSAATSMQFYDNNEGTLDVQEVLDNCTLINDNAQYLSHTIDSFKFFRNKRTKKDIFSIKSLVDKLLSLTNTCDVKMITSIEKDIIVYANESEVIQILLNLINNSIDALEDVNIKDKYILIDIYINRKDYIIKIKDSAGGINEEIINRIFEPYFTTKHKSRGKGLGLYKAYIVTNKIKGTISVQNVDFYCTNNDKNYKGAEFTVILPIK